MLEQFLPTQSDIWNWRCATLEDLDDIVNMVIEHFKVEVDAVFQTDAPLFKKNLARAILEQAYNPLLEFVIVARHKQSDDLLAWSWISRGIYTVYSADEIADARFAHVDLKLSNRQRITMLAQTLQQWELWARCGMIPIISSSTIRSEQRAFLRLRFMEARDV